MGSDIKRELIPIPVDRVFSYKLDTDLWPIWHSHPEIDILLFLKNSGHHLTGDFIGPFEPGSLFFNSPNIPHCFTPNEPDENNPNKPATIAIQFSEQTIGAGLLNKSEMRLIRDFVRNTKLSYQFFGDTRKNAVQIMQRMASLRGAQSLMAFIELLETLAAAPPNDKHTLVSPNYNPVLNEKNINRIETVRQWIDENLTQSISLENAAALIGISPKSFSYFFKKNTGQSFVQYVTQLRVGLACKLLINTDKSIVDVCYASGFNNLSNFNRRFRTLRGMPPKRFRTQHASIRQNATRNNFSTKT